MNYSPIQKVKVGIDFDGNIIPVGQLALHNRDIYFEYDNSFIDNELEISPISLPLQPSLKKFDYKLFEGLAGVFNDSLPDGWGRLLLDRYASTNNIPIEQITPLDRLSFVGKHAIGALTYEPDNSEDIDFSHSINLDILANDIEQVLEGNSVDVINELVNLNGSSAGARPKALIGVDDKFQHIIHGSHEIPNSHSAWLVKFPNMQDGKDSGAIEYVYSLMAKEAGLDMPDTYLFPAKKSAGYFAIKRFDRIGANRLHTHTACGLLHSDFRMPSLDYDDLISLTEVLTKDIREVEKIYRLAVFNVLSHNRDDHSKNFSFIMDRSGKWQISPPYDLTFSSGPRGEQSTMVMGEGKNPSIHNLKQLGKKAALNDKTINTIIDQTRQALNKWEKLGKEYSVSKTNINKIKGLISAQAKTSKQE